MSDIILLSPGTQLRNAREKAGLSIRDIAEKMHQLPKQIAALESDDYQQFNGDIFCRGYIKTYSNLLGLDTQALLEAYSELCPKPVEQVSAPALSRRHVQYPFKGHSIQYWGAAASILVIVILWFFTANDSTEVAVTPVMSAAAVEIDKQQVIAPIVQADSASTVVEIDAETNSLLSSAESSSQQEIVDKLDSGLALSSVNADLGSVKKIVNGSLLMTFTGDCWVQVKDANQVLIYADMKRASDTLELDGEAPFYIVLGYAPAVTVSFNSESVEVPVSPENNSARFVVGKL